MLAHDQRGFGEADGFRRHDFVGGGIFQHAILMDAGLVSKGIRSGDGLIDLHFLAGDALHQARQAHDMLGLYADIKAQHV